MEFLTAFPLGANLYGKGGWFQDILGCGFVVVGVDFFGQNLDVRLA